MKISLEKKIRKLKKSMLSNDLSFEFLCIDFSDGVSSKKDGKKEKSSGKDSKKKKK
jgi:hypothetical protein